MSQLSKIFNFSIAKQEEELLHVYYNGLTSKQTFFFSFMTGWNFETKRKQSQAVENSVYLDFQKTEIYKCVNCSTSLQVFPPNNLCQTTIYLIYVKYHFSTFFCCKPLGLVSVKANNNHAL